MRKETVTYEIYTFEELDAKAKEKALEEHRHVNVEFDYWFEHIEEEVKEVGLKLVEFDTYRGICKLRLLTDHETLATKIRYVRQGFDLLENLAKESNKDLWTRASAEYSLDFAQVEDKHTEDCKEYGNSYDCLACERVEEIEKTFISDLEHAVLGDLRSTYEWSTSDEAIIEFFECNDIEFHKDGRTY